MLFVWCACGVCEGIRGRRLLCHVIDDGRLFLVSSTFIFEFLRTPSDWDHFEFCQDVSSYDECHTIYVPNVTYNVVSNHVITKAQGILVQ